MPTVERATVLGAGYETDPIREYAESFSRTVSNIMSEATVDYYKDFASAITMPSVKENLRQFFVEGTYDKEDPQFQSPVAVDNHIEEMNTLFENDVKGLISESCAINTFNPLVGMALPMHKNIMMNMVWDKGGIPKKTAPAEKFTRTMETRILKTPTGQKIDMWLEQNKMTKAMRSVNPWKTHRFVVGATDQTATNIEAVSPMEKAMSYDFIKLLNGKQHVDHIDVETYISAVLIKDCVFEADDVLPDENGFIPDNGGQTVREKAGKGDTEEVAAETHDLWVKVRMKFTPGYGEIKRQLMKPVGIGCKQKDASGTVTEVIISDVITANIQEDSMMIASMNGAIKGVEVSTKLDASTRTIDTCTVSWEEKTDMVEIGTDEGISATVSPEEIKDTSVLYNINQVTKVMSLMKTAVANRKNDEIHEQMNESYSRLPESQRFFGIFDYAPREGYMLDQIEWRQRTFWDYFDTQITQMLRVLNDPNMTVSVFGEPDIVRRITPKTYTYSAPGNIGPVELDFSKTVVTSDKRVYSFVGSDDMRTAEDPEFIITLNPRNTMRIVYVIYDYQFYISNEIRNNNNPALPNILVFERWKFDEYQPIQGRIRIVNPSGLRPGDTDTKPFTPFVGYN